MAQLDIYRSKRDFHRTREPRGRTGAKERAKGHAYVIQKHAARRLHYDLRLELDGVLKSWAVTKGPSLVPGDKRLAVEVEDHPVEYGTFEGSIPEGDYGGGNVIVWDRGSWTPDGDPHRGLAKGRLDFTLHGKKLRGHWHLVRMRGKPREKRKNWLLIKGDDEAARDAGDPDVLEEQPDSVVSGRAVADIGKLSKPAKRRTAAKAKPSGGGSTVKLTHPDRVYWPDAGVTKQHLADYYSGIWRWIAPHVVARPLALLRCPGGVETQCFYQKQPWKGLHRSIEVIDNPGEGGDEVLTIRDLDGLIALVQSGVLEIHPWGANVGNLDHPDRLIIDLDPGPNVKWSDLMTAAREVRERMQDDGLRSYLKTTGGKGLHVVAPLAPKAGWDEVKTYAHGIAEAMARDTPDLYTANLAKTARKRHIFVDYLRNGRGNTAVAAYSTRAREGAPVSTPLTWDELTEDIGSDHFRVANVPARLAKLKADLWSDFFKLRQTLPSRTRRTR